MNTIPTRIRKHRAWHKESKQMIYASSAQIFKWLEEGQPIEVMDMEGQKDKNGKEIYEGDILLSSIRDGFDPMGVVYYYPPQFIVQTSEDVPLTLGDGSVNIKQLRNAEVIGNIYENPELLNHP